MEETNIISTQIECDCGCAILKIADWDDLDKSIIALYVLAYNEKSRPTFWKIKHRLKAAWYMLKGKDFHLYELVVPREDMKNIFKEYLAKHELLK